MNFRKLKQSSLTLFFFLLSLSSTLFADPANKEIAFEGFNFKLIENGETASININGKQGPLKIHAEVVESPTRFLIDVLGVPSKTARSIELNGTIVQKIRVGIHKDKTRIVFDIKPNISDLKFNEENKSDPNISLYEYKYELNGTINGIDESITPEPTKTPEATKTPTPEPTATSTKTLPTPTSTPTSTPTKEPVQETPIPINKPTATPIELEEEITKDFSTPELTKDKIEVELPEHTKQDKEPTPIVTLVPDASTASSSKPLRDIDQAILDMEKNSLTKKAVLKNVVFQTTSDNIQSSIAVSISQIDTFNLKQVSESKYILELPATKLRAPHLSLPQYPPDSFKGFVYIKAEETELDSSVIIEVDPGVKLIAEVSQGKLWIKSK